jgi:threonine dehydratase
VLAGTAVRTPLVRLDADCDAEVYVKLETLQPVNSFKIRGAGNAILQASDGELAGGVVTASAGNMAQGVAYAARLRGVPATIVVPEGAPATKVAAVERFGGSVVALPYDDWWRALVDGYYEGAASSLFVHPVANREVMAGNGTIGLELLEDLPDLDAVVVPYGGGGLVTGIASAVKASRPDARVYSAEPETGAPASDAFGGGPGEVDYTRSWVDGAGSRSVIPAVWEHVSGLIDGALVVPLDDAAAAVRLLAERVRVIAEGAGALGVAAAVAGKAGGGKVVAVVSGGNIDPGVFSRIVAGETP